LCALTLSSISTNIMGKLWRPGKLIRTCDS
jgi:hypothetical protein